jgi:class 3 adenylate cyclase/DNA-binding response OmpR family regulator/predicted ATPase
LVLSGQTALRAAVARALAPTGFQIEIASSEEAARRLLRKQRFEAAVIGPGSRAVRDLAFLREVQDAVGKLVILADDADTRERFAGYLPEGLVCRSHPLESEKLVAFLGGLTPPKAFAADTANITVLAHFEGCTLDIPGRIFLDANRREIVLTRNEFALLVTFTRNSGRVLSRTQLRSAIDGGNADAYDRSVDMLVARLRRKIEPDSAKTRFIVTVPGIGYKFAPRIRDGDRPEMPLHAAGSRDRTEREEQRAERRQLTILSCQVLGFAALAAKLDPEDLGPVISRVYAACTAVLARFNGTVARASGDSVLAYFGHPVAHEDDAECAVRAALELLRVIARIETNIEAAPAARFRARIGIATGLMVIGELSSIGAKEPSVVGEALNLAVHMQNAAPADGVVIAASTRDLIGRFFHCRELDPVEVEEGHKLAAAWRVVDEVAGVPRFHALRHDAMLELVGREAEMKRLSQCWSNVLHGSGQVTVLTGEAGIGKSRLVLELEERLRFEPHATIRYSGLPHRAEAPMSALLDELQRSAGFLQHDTAAQRLEKLQKLFAATLGATQQATALIANLLSLPFESPSDIGQLSPQKRKERTFTALLAQIESIASQQPVLAVVEDAQWVDPTSFEFLALLLERARALPLLLVIVGRPEFAPPWPDHSYVTALTLTRLSRWEAAALIHRVAGDRGVPVKVEAEIVARADGVPLFVEELTKCVLERDANDGDHTPEPVEPYAVRSIPTTLQGLLLARFDRLGRGKEVAQAGAVIGREFSFELLHMIAGIDEPTLTSALDRLVSSGLAFRRGSPPHATFVFKHALVRDAAYHMLPRQQRRKLHANVVRSYEENFQETIKAQPELLAYHCREAGKPVEAIAYLLVAAERALQRSATTEALSQLAQARELISAAPESRNRLQLELTLEITSARAFLAARGYTAPETREAYGRARDRCEALDDQGSLPLILHGQWLGAWTAADHQSALEHARQLNLWGERNNDQIGFAVAHADIGMTLTTLGQLEEARGHLDQALRIDRFVLPGRQPFVASDVDGRISALSFMHNCLLLLGFPDKAKVVANEAVSLSPRNLYSRALAQMRMLRMRVFERDASTTAEIGPSILRFVQEQGYPYFVGTAMIYTGWALARCGDAAGGIAVCERGLAELQSIGGKCWLPLFLALLAECHEQAGHPDRSAAAIAQALECVEATGERIWEAEIHRLKGKLLLNGGDADAASACFSTALHKARAQQAKLLELRAAVSLAELLMREHKSRQARDLLMPVYCSFTEGFDFIDLREAKALLDSLPASAGTSPPPLRAKRARSAS